MTRLLRLCVLSVCRVPELCVCYFLMSVFLGVSCKLRQKEGKTKNSGGLTKTLFEDCNRGSFFVRTVWECCSSPLACYPLLVTANVF